MKNVFVGSGGVFSRKLIEYHLQANENVAW